MGNRQPKQSPEPQPQEEDGEELSAKDEEVRDCDKSDPEEESDDELPTKYKYEQKVVKNVLMRSGKLSHAAIVSLADGELRATAPDDFRPDEDGVKDVINAINGDVSGIVEGIKLGGGTPECVPGKMDPGKAIYGSDGKGGGLAMFKTHECIILGFFDSKPAQATRLVSEMADDMEEYRLKRIASGAVDSEPSESSQESAKIEEPLATQLSEDKEASDGEPVDLSAKYKYEQKVVKNVLMKSGKLSHAAIVSLADGELRATAPDDFNPDQEGIQDIIDAINDDVSGIAEGIKLGGGTPECVPGKMDPGKAIYGSDGNGGGFAMFKTHECIILGFYDSKPAQATRLLSEMADDMEEYRLKRIASGSIDIDPAEGTNEDDLPVPQSSESEESSDDEPVEMSAKYKYEQKVMKNVLMRSGKLSHAAIVSLADGELRATAPDDFNPDQDGIKDIINAIKGDVSGVAEGIKLGGGTPECVPGKVYPGKAIYGSDGKGGGFAMFKTHECIILGFFNSKPVQATRLLSEMADAMEAYRLKRIASGVVDDEPSESTEEVAENDEQPAKPTSKDNQSSSDDEPVELSAKYKYEQKVVKNVLMKSGKLSHAAIVSLADGELRATAPDDFNPDQEGIQDIIDAINDDVSGIAEGIKLGGGTPECVPGKMDPGKAIYGSDGKGGGFAMFKTHECIILGFYDSKPAQATRLLSEMADDMEEYRLKRIASGSIDIDPAEGTNEDDLPVPQSSESEESSDDEPVEMSAKYKYEQKVMKNVLMRSGKLSHAAIVSLADGELRATAPDDFNPDQDGIKDIINAIKGDVSGVAEGIKLGGGTPECVPGKMYPGKAIYGSDGKGGGFAIFKTHQCIILGFFNSKPVQATRVLSEMADAMEAYRLKRIASGVVDDEPSESTEEVAENDEQPAKPTSKDNQSSSDDEPVELSAKYKYEQKVVKNVLMKSGKLSHAAIVSLADGELRATAPDDFNPDQEGVKDIINAINGDVSGIVEGIKLGGGTPDCVPGKMDPGKAIYGSDGKGGGLAMFKTHECIILGFFDSKPAQATRLVSEMADDMEEYRLKRIASGADKDTTPVEEECHIEKEQNTEEPEDKSGGDSPEEELEDLPAHYKYEQNVVNNVLMKSGKLTHVAIVSLSDGELRATAPDDFRPDQDGVEDIIKAIVDNDVSGIIEGIDLGGGTPVCVPGKLDPGDAIYGSDGKGGGFAMFKTLECIIIGFYNSRPAQATRLIGEMADDMEEYRLAKIARDKAASTEAAATDDTDADKDAAEPECERPVVTLPEKYEFEQKVLKETLVSSGKLTHAAIVSLSDGELRATAPANFSPDKTGTMALIKSLDGDTTETAEGIALGCGTHVCVPAKCDPGKAVYGSDGKGGGIAALRSKECLVIGLYTGRPAQAIRLVEEVVEDMEEEGI